MNTKPYVHRNCTKQLEYIRQLCDNNNWTCKDKMAAKFKPINDAFDWHKDSKFHKSQLKIDLLAIYDLVNFVM